MSPLLQEVLCGRRELYGRHWMWSLTLPPAPLRLCNFVTSRMVCGGAPLIRPRVADGPSPHAREPASHTCTHSPFPGGSTHHLPLPGWGSGHLGRGGQLGSPGLPHMSRDHWGYLNKGVPHPPPPPLTPISILSLVDRPIFKLRSQG